MQIMKIIIKAGLGLAAAIFAGGDLLFRIGIFGIVYGFVTYYLWFIRVNSDIIGDKIYINIFLPFIPVVIFSLILNSIPFGKTAEAIGSWIIVIVSYICVVMDVRKIFNMRGGGDI